MSLFLYYFLYALLIALLIFVAFYSYYDFKLGAAPVPSSNAAARKLAEILPELKGKNVVDLGAGWGGISFACARACPDKNVTGIEFAPMPFWYAKIRKCFNSDLKNLQFLRTDLFKYDMSDVQIAFIYMPPEFMPRLMPKIAEMPRGGYVVSNSEKCEGLTLEKTVDVAGLLPEKIYIYRCS